jgi:hypothetical protein
VKARVKSMTSGSMPRRQAASDEMVCPLLVRNVVSERQGGLWKGESWGFRLEKRQRSRFSYLPRTDLHNALHKIRVHNRFACTCLHHRKPR